jgi:hypothetical protein
MALVAVPVAMATSASAAPRHDDGKHAFAAVELQSGGNNEQFALVVANASHKNRGFVDYTNFNVAAPSHVWSLDTGQSEGLKVWANGTEYDHTFNAGETLQAKSNDDVGFTGTGEYNANPSVDTWTVAGNIKKDDVTFTLTYGPWEAGYWAAFWGDINHSDGSASGHFKDSNGTTGTWSLPAYTFRTVLNYYAHISTDKIKKHARSVDLTFTIPAGNAYSGDVVEWVFSNKNGVKTWAQGVNGSTPGAETVEAGTIDVS